VTRRIPASDLLLILGGALRLTHLITHDKIGEWAVVGPARKWARPYEEAAQSVAFKRGVTPDEIALIETGTLSPEGKLFSGLECPWCVGFWIGGVVIIGTLTIGRLPIVGTLWRIALGALSLNYVVGHVSSRID
jgi:hypothetical protein